MLIPFPRSIPRALLTVLAPLMGVVLVAGTAQAQQARAATTLAGEMSSYDIRYPLSEPNGISLMLTGPDLKVADVVESWDTNTLLGGIALQWGKPTIEALPQPQFDPFFPQPSMGLNQIRVTWRGARRPDLTGEMIHIGIRMRRTSAITNSQILWNSDGIAIERPDSLQITWMLTTNHTVICLQNNTPSSLFAYGFRFFAPEPVAGVNGLPTLGDLLQPIDPTQFGATGWTSGLVPQPGWFQIRPLQRCYIRIPVASRRTHVFQCATSTQAFDFDAPSAPAPLDSNTNFIVTSRAIQEFASDLDGDGAVGVPDIEWFRQEFGQVSADREQPE